MKDFKIGDRVRDVSVTRRFGTITSVNHYGDPDCLVVQFDDDEEGVCYVKDLEIFPDPKAAFLTEMQALLKKYNAYIFPCGYEVDGLSFVINDKDEIHYDMYEWSTMHDLSADNIFNYEKDQDMLTFIQTHATGSDCTAPYDVKLDKPYTVGEFIKEVLTTRPNEWGEFTVKNKKGWYVGIEYHYGEIETLDKHQVSKLPDDLCALPVKEVKAVGGWSNMDYDLMVD